MDVIKIYAKMSAFRQKFPHVYIVLRAIYEINNKITSIWYYLFRIFPIIENKIVIDNYTGKGYADNPKYIVNELFSRDKKYNIIWLIYKKNLDSVNLPKDISVVRFGSFKSIYQLATAKIWVDNVRKLGNTRKRNGQYYIQTWHGFGPKSYLGNAVLLSKAQINALKKDSKISDLFISNNKLLSNIYRNEFWYFGDILECGFPRNDILFKGPNVEIYTKVITALHIPLNKKIILYAPTFRENLSIESSVLDFKNLLFTLKNRFGNEWVILTRLHHLVANQSLSLPIDNDIIFDASQYLDMQELLLVSDILITDYSSCMFDFAVTRKPCFLYHPDEKEYDDTRGFCIHPQELPFPCAHTNEELQDLITTFDDAEYRRILDTYLEKIGFIEDGNASKAVVDWIEKKIEEDS